MNKVVLVGRLVSEPDLRFVGEDSAVSSFTLAVDKYNSKTKEKEADFIRCKVWGKQAENLAEYMGKGDRIGISGRIETGSYDKDGTKVYTTEVVCSEVEYLTDKKKEGPQPNNNQRYNNQRNNNRNNK